MVQLALLIRDHQPHSRASVYSLGLVFIEFQGVIDVPPPLVTIFIANPFSILLIPECRLITELLKYGPAIPIR